MKSGGDELGVSFDEGVEVDDGGCEGRQSERAGLLQQAVGTNSSDPC